MTAPEIANELRRKHGDTNALIKACGEIERLRAALESIASNTCCDGCQEASKVARAALKAKAVMASRLTQLEGKADG